MARGGNTLQDRVGKKFGMYTVISFEGYKTYSSGLRRSLWKVRCECGTEKVLTAKRLTDKEAGSCGCVQKEAARKAVTTHGQSYNKMYKVWTSIKQRCFNPKDEGYNNYGGRGITMHPDWVESFEAFYAYVGDKPAKGMSLDRIDNNGNYEPGNLRWANQSQQTLNSRRSKKYIIDNVECSTLEISNKYGINYSTLLGRLAIGMTPEEAVSIPIGKAKSYIRNQVSLSASSSAVTL